MTRITLLDSEIQKTFVEILTKEDREYFWIPSVIQMCKQEYVQRVEANRTSIKLLNKIYV